MGKFKGSESGSLPEDKLREMLFTTQKKALCSESEIFFSQDQFDPVLQNPIHYQVVLIKCANVQRAVPGTMQRELSCPVGS